MSVDLTKWPNGGDVMTYCAGAGLSLPPSVSQFATVQAQSARAEFERLTRCRPFLAAGQSSRAFESPAGAYLDLSGGLVSLTSLSVGGQALTLNQQFWLKPDNAPLEGRPYTGIDFGGPRDYGRGQWGGYDGGYGGGLPYFTTGAGQRGIVVVGLWGYCEALPADVWYAVLQRAAAAVARVAGVALSGGVKQWERAGVSKVYKDSAYGELVGGGSDEFAECVKRYRRLVVA